MKNLEKIAEIYNKIDNKEISKDKGMDKIMDLVGDVERAGFLKCEIKLKDGEVLTQKAFPVFTENTQGRLFLDFFY